MINDSANEEGKQMDELGSVSLVVFWGKLHHMLEDNERAARSLLQLKRSFYKIKTHSKKNTLTSPILMQEGMH